MNLVEPLLSFTQRQIRIIDVSLEIRFYFGGRYAHVQFSHHKSNNMIADIYISTSMETFEHRKYKTRGENGNN